jgi:DNA segregation ATPase FtsK/SpoIIIE-like protein
VEEAALEIEEEDDQDDQKETAGDEAPQSVVPVRAEQGSSAPAAPQPAAPPTKEVVLKPLPPPRPEASVALDAETEGWSKLVYDAGCVILEQKRVAVSMLEKRFGIDFDQACRVLDELQQAGLIGPYMGGRTRDILLTREQWQPHAPHAS